MYERQLVEATGGVAGAEHQEELEEMLTPDEKDKVTTIKRNLAK